MSWIFLVVGAQFINAIVAFGDKYLVTDEKAIPKPFVYAFYSCLFTSFWILMYFVGLIPGLSEFGFPSFASIHFPTIQVIGMSFFAAYTFFMALVSLYDALKHSNTSDVMPVVGSVSAIGTFFASWLFLNTTLSNSFFWGVLFLATGSFLVTKIKFTKQLVLLTVHSGIFFALHFIAMKGLFMETNFDDGFFWSRIAFILFAFSLLLIPAYNELILAQSARTTKKTGAIIVANKILAGIAGFMILKATDWGDVAVVQALDGLKFVFILLIGYFASRFLPDSFGENEQSKLMLLKKALAVSIIVIGFAFLFA